MEYLPWLATAVKIKQLPYQSVMTHSTGKTVTEEISRKNSSGIGHSQPTRPNKRIVTSFISKIGHLRISENHPKTAKLVPDFGSFDWTMQYLDFSKNLTQDGLKIHVFL